VDLKDLKVKLFCDSGDLNEMAAIKEQEIVKGFTCNPSLVRKAGVADYLAFCREAVQVAGDMALGTNVFVKVPVVSSQGLHNYDVINRLAYQGIRVNVTACFTESHVKAAEASLRTEKSTPSYISIFAGRVADTGRCPEQLISNASWYVQGTPTEIIWASVREPINVVQADRCGCQVITIFPELLRRLDRFGRNLDEFARETSEMFYRDAIAAGYTL
jgi:transaldolase